MCTEVEKALSKFLTEELKEILSDIDPRLRFSCLWSEFAHTYNKEFILDTNYPKGHGAWFYAWIKRHYPGILMFHFESIHGTHQDIIYSYSLAMHLNRLPTPQPIT